MPKSEAADRTADLSSDAGPSPQPDDLRVAARCSFEALEPVSGAEWTPSAGGLTWDCRRTLEHIAYCLDRYSLNLATPSPVRSPRTPNQYPHLPNREVLKVVQRRAAVLAAVAAASAPTVRGTHIWGNPDPAGYIAMGCVEILLHTDDIAQALGAIPVS